MPTAAEFCAWTRGAGVEREASNLRAAPTVLPLSQFGLMGKRKPKKRKPNILLDCNYDSITDGSSPGPLRLYLAVESPFAHHLRPGWWQSMFDRADPRYLTLATSIARPNVQCTALAFSHYMVCNLKCDPASAFVDPWGDRARVLLSSTKPGHVLGCDLEHYCAPMRPRYLLQRTRGCPQKQLASPRE